MNNPEYTDEYWKTHLTPVAYASLRRGEIEAPHTGVFVSTTTAGTYSCAGCGARLFDSDAKLTDSSGYATFRVDEQNTALQTIRTYTDEGKEITSAVCSVCGGRIGMVGSSAVHSARDMEQGTHVQCIHAFSASLTLRKSFTPRSYPITYVVLVCALLFCGFFVWRGVIMLLETARQGMVGDSVSLFIDGAEVRAETVRLISGGVAHGEVALESPRFVVLSGEEKLSLVPKDVSVDVLWLDNQYRPLEAGIAVLPDTEGVLDAPDGALFALVAPHGEYPDTVFRTSVQVYVQR